ncbi:MAG: response regulator transcription factor [Acidimicrobiales bacterium]
MAVQQRAHVLSAAGSRVLVVESDAQTAAMARCCLERAGFSVEVSTSGPQALGWLERSWPELVVLDPRLPGEEHLSFQRLRACSDVPVVMISPLADNHERTWGLQLGADDYVPSPLCADELVARVRSVLRRVPPLAHLVTAEPMAPARLELDDASRRARVGDAWIALTTIEFRLLAFLASHPAQAFRREELLEAVWGYTVGDGSTVTVHVRRLREKVEPDPAHPVFIVTLWGVGYRFDPSGGADDGSHV